ncbi:MAG: MarR family EPS-associated transcriptional regulator [Desulfobacterales bacterium]|uniref:MarR family EPS-associated transcriptional regulator n=1 Tax=Candidatus Desulfatibia vada TaxID=2841696 RepID=A0A8J6TNN6_9BACT|nr:MarR family EPS-associated transcriptional regulator [Candidatus Desulfatibia vada]MBL6972020.1 MarR family EPS-associated transcriptional regulator [Desulfobacterales bacterium]
MLLTEKHFQILETLGGQEISTQRQLADSTGISLGQINYVLKYLLSKGLVKIGNFHKNPHKIGYVYLLTPKGIETKAKLAARFVVSKLKEYNNIRSKLAERLTSIAKNGPNRIIFIGPEIIKELIASIIYEKALALVLVAHCEDWQDLKKHDDDSFDFVVDFTANQDANTAKPTGISSDRVISLW